jgi:rhomboid protease GluP
MDWKQILESMGVRTTWWSWRIRRWREKLGETGAFVRTQADNATYQHKLCPNCGGLVDRDTVECPRCNTKLVDWRVNTARRAIGMISLSAFSVANAIIALNVAVMAAMMMKFGGISLLNPDVAALVQAGGLAPDRVAHGEWWRLITYAFLHGGLIHIGFNLSSLTQVGPVTERAIGRSRFLVLYLLSALGGAAADMAWHHWFNNRPLVVGASGAIFGLIGFGLTFNYFYGGRHGRSDARVYLNWAIYSFAFGFVMPAVDNVCHAGGFVTGAVLGWVIERSLRAGDRWDWAWRIVAALLAVGALAAGAMVVF